MKKRIERNNAAVALVLLFLVTGTLTAETEIFPANPTEFDFITITVSGEWPNSCVPNVSYVTVIGDSIHFEVFDDYPPGACLQVVTSWELTNYVGPLSPGTYTIYAHLLVDPCNPVSEPYAFVVSGESLVFAPGDFDEDGQVDCDDLRVLALAFMSISGDDNWNPVCDISDPNDEVIDGQDFGVFAMDWEGCGDPPPEPGMDYYIEECDLAKVAGPDKNGLRFSVTVQGNHIFFEDMIHTSCCPDELLLEVTLEGDLITIYEIVHSTLLCDCMCDFPVTATLGPFEPDTYTLEVYQNTSFIGSTGVTIE
jgi:hypothetical protein